MNQKVWGPGAWLFLHSMSFNYSPKKKQEMVDFLKAFNKVLPCRYCRENMKKHMDKMPPQLESRRDFVKWMIDFHNIVNVQEGKSVVSFDEAIDIYEKMYGKKLDLNDPIDINDIMTFDGIKEFTNRNRKPIVFGLLFVILAYILYSQLVTNRNHRSKRRK